MVRGSSHHPPRLLAVDLDGTLVRTDGSIHAADRGAILRAREAGADVTLATGRPASLSLALARSLELDTPLVCDDGAALVCPLTGRLCEATPLQDDAVAALLRAMTAHALAPFVF